MVRGVTVGQLTAEIARRTIGRSSRVVVLDYPARPRSRYGHGLPRHPEIEAIIASGRTRYAAFLESILEVRGHLVRIPVACADDSAEPCWTNGWLPGLDGSAIYAAIAHGAPRTYLEVGSGNSTKFARRAIADHKLQSRIISIDPRPRARIDSLCDEVIRRPVEDVDLSTFGQLSSGDVLFIDNSHRVFQNSDANVMLLEVLPRLAPGVVVGIHDIFLPDDYPPHWHARHYSEQYVLAAYLLGGQRFFDTLLPAHYVSTDPELSAILDSLWLDPALAGADRHGGAFWLRTKSP